MKKRQLEIIKLLRTHLILSVNELLSLFDISIRTLYYDIEIINESISEYGVLLIRKNELIYKGSKYFFTPHFEESLMETFVASDDRRTKMLISIILEEGKSLEDFSSMFQVARTTIFNDMNHLKSDLEDKGILLYYDAKRKIYCLDGEEKSIRWLYLELLPHFDIDFSNISEEVYEFNETNSLNLSDYSLFSLDKFVTFVNKRVKQGNMIGDFIQSYDTRTRKNYKRLDLLLATRDVYEREFISAYIISLSGQNGDSINEMINSQVKDYTNSLMFLLKTHLALHLENWDQKLMQDLYSHLLASYYRIFFGFPAYNPSLTDIRIRYYSLYKNVKHVVRSMEGYDVFVKMREEEIGFLTAYIGGFIAKSKTTRNNNSKVLIVCPQGRAFSNHLAIQIQNLYPNITVIGSCSVDMIDNYQGKYDQIVSTIELPNHYEHIKVNGFLNRLDRERLQNLFLQKEHALTETILEKVRESCIIKNEEKLREDINGILLNKHIVRRQPMLKELLSEEKIVIKEEVENWKEAVKIASSPLLERGLIEKEYVEEMIINIEKYGPYVVIAEGFALPHASGTEYVNELSMSMLILHKPVDMKGKSVNVVTVLATVDNESHLKALSSLSDILSCEANLEVLGSGQKSEILKLIENNEGE